MITALATLPYLQLIRVVHVLAWGVVAAYSWRSAWRTMQGRAYANDAFKTCFFFVGMLFVGFGARWWITGDDLSFAMIYAVSGLLAFHVYRVSRAHGHGGV